MEEGSLIIKHNNIDLILSRIGFGRYQMIVFFLIGWFWFTDGAELVIISVITRVLEKEWGLSSLQIEVMGGVIYLGMILGTVLIGPLGDRVGRRKILIITSTSLVVSGVVSGLMPNFWSFVLTRVALGVSIGGLIPGATSTLLETCTVKTRGIMVVLENFVFQLGVVTLILLAMWLIPGLRPEHWRELLVLAAAPGIIAVVLVCLLLDESPRFSAITQQFDKSAKTLNRIARLNKQFPLNEDEIRMLMDTERPPNFSMKFRVHKLFSSEYRRTTLQLCFGWFSVGFVYYGLLFILPRTIASQSSDDEVLTELLVVNLIQLPTAILPTFILEVKSLGRKNTLLLCSVLQLGFCIACSVVQDRFLFQVFVTGLAFVDNIYFDVIYPYTSELFDTSVRGTGFALASSWARFAGFVSPFILLGLHELSPVLPYIAMAIVSFFTILNCFFFKADTTGLDLDLVH